MPERDHVTSSDPGVPETEPPRPPGRTLRTTLILVAVAALVPLVGLHLYTQRSLEERASQEWRQSVSRLAAVATARHQEALGDTRNVLRTLAQLPGVPGGEPDVCRDLLPRLFEQRPYYTALGIVAPDGWTRCTAPAEESFYVGGRPYFQEALRTGRLSLSEYHVGHITGRSVVTMALPVLGPDSAVTAVLAAGLNLQSVVSLPPGVPLPEHTTLTVFDRQGRVLSRLPDGQTTGTPTVSDSLVAAVRGADSERLVTAPDLDGTRRVFAVQPVTAGDAELLGGYVAVGYAPSAAAAIFGRAARRGLLGLAVAAVLLVLGIWLVMDRMMLSRLAPVLRTSERLGAGELDARTGLAAADDEIGRLAATVDRMAENLETLHRERARVAEAEIQETEDRLRLLTENIEGAFWIWDMEEDRTIYVSPGFEAIWGRGPEAVYASPEAWLETIHPEDRGEARLEEEDLEGPSEREYRVVRPDGSVRWVLDRSFPIRDAEGEVYRLAGVAQDITGRKQLEEALHQSRKLEAVGRLAGGVAHDFNNVLTTIQGNVRLLLDEMEPDDPRRHELEEVDTAARRAVDLTRQLLAFSRKQAMRFTVLDLNEVVRSTTRMLRRLIGEDIELETDLTPRLEPVRADRSQMEQVLVNLAANARDAMPDGGTLRITTRNVPAPNQLPAEEFGLPDEREFVLLKVTDTGVGLDDEVRDRIFEPFFTTKELGKGTGLGLASVYGVVKQTGGYIWVSGSPGGGTTFQIYLPCAEVEESEEASAVDSGNGAEGPFSGSETVLLVEDEDGVRAVARRSLERYGYRVLEAEDGAEALQVFERNRDEVDLLLTDVVMPRLNGPDLCELLRNSHPSLPVLYMSGYPARDGERTPFDVGSEPIVQKPFTAEGLAREVRTALDRPVGEPAG